jgi:hypothetical protein|tara:strand:- start:3043 stop:3177 length:135 start_codon:yes stop_codon:yes gene_type:complete
MGLTYKLKRLFDLLDQYGEYAGGFFEIKKRGPRRAPIKESYSKD